MRTNNKRKLITTSDELAISLELPGTGASEIVSPRPPHGQSVPARLTVSKLEYDRRSPNILYTKARLPYPRPARKSRHDEHSPEPPRGPGPPGSLGATGEGPGVMSINGRNATRLQFVGLKCFLVRLLHLAPCLPAIDGTATYATVRPDSLARASARK